MSGLLSGLFGLLSGVPAAGATTAAGVQLLATATVNLALTTAQPITMPSTASSTIIVACVLKDPNGVTVADNNTVLVNTDGNFNLAILPDSWQGGLTTGVPIYNYQPVNKQNMFYLKSVPSVVAFVQNAGSVGTVTIELLGYVN